MPEPAPAKPDELLEFLQHFFYIYPNLNDTFGYATADSERIALDIDKPFGPDEDGYVSNGEVLVRAWRQYGLDGIRAFVAKMRDREPLRELRTVDYNSALLALEGWSYDPD